LRAWLEAAGRARGRLKLLRYEDLLEKPPETIRELANALDLEITTAEAEALAERYLFRTLQAPGSASALFEPGHMWQPSAGKWRQHLGPAHAAILHRLDYAELLGEFGYESDFAAVLAAQETAPEGTEPDPAWLAWYDFTTHRTQGSDVVFTAPECKLWPIKGTGLQVFANDDERAELLTRLLATPYWRAFLESI
jgi:hypothetical protein